MPKLKSFYNDDFVPQLPQLSKGHTGPVSAVNNILKKTHRSLEFWHQYVDDKDENIEKSAELSPCLALLFTSGAQLVPSRG